MTISMNRHTTQLLIVFLCGLHSGTSNSYGSTCGWAKVNRQTTLCCSGLVYVRSGIQPACCGSVAYDAYYSYCCDGHIHRKSGFGRCCGTRTYDARSSMCRDGNVISHDHRYKVQTGSVCCVRNNLRLCCRQGQTCCTKTSSADLSASNSVESWSSEGNRELSSRVSIPGFRPACCEEESSVRKAHCCSLVTQKAGVMPSCCDTDRHRPTCCKTSVTSFVCCHASGFTGVGGRSTRCCRGSSSPSGRYPYYPTTTTTTAYPLVPVRPSPLPEAGSCCFWVRPSASCCLALRVQPEPHPVVPAGRPSDGSSGTQCCTYRISCCSQREYSRHDRCCRSSRSASGPAPLCCSSRSIQQRWILPDPTTSQLPPQHRCYSCRVNANNHVDKEPPVLAYPLNPTPRSPGSNVAAHSGGAWQPSSLWSSSTADGGPGWARLSCCNSGYQKQCCRNALRLAGVYADCCNPDVIADSSSYSNRYYQNQPQQKQQGSYNNYREAICNGRTYNIIYYLCCSGVVRLKYGGSPACCGPRSFDASSERCCGRGIVRKHSCSM